MRAFRIVALALIGLAAVVIVLLPADTPTDHSAEVRVALAGAELNNSQAEGAPQQTVVNGWVARDLLAIISSQLDEQASSNDRKTPWLLALGVLALVVIGLTSSVPGPSRPEASQGPTTGAGAPVDSSSFTGASPRAMEPPLDS